MNGHTVNPQGNRPRYIESEAIRIVGDALAKLKFGGIHLTVHEGKLVQIEIIEKRRFA